MMQVSFRKLSVLLALAFSGTASAAAFQLWEQNASGLGTAYAGSAAIADNASTIFFNPAGMVRLGGVQLSTGIAGQANSYKFRNDGSTPLGGGDGGNAGGWSALPNAYASWQLTPTLSAGLGVFSPFGFSTEYDGGWLGRNQAIKSEIRTLNINPALAYRLNDKVALGLGVNYQKIDADFTRVGSRLSADDASWGWNAGALFTLSPAMRVGVSYRSAVKHTLEGDSAGTPAEARLKLPDTCILSVWQQVSDRWEAMGDLSYTRWESLQSFHTVRRSDGATLDDERLNYGNAWRFAWGSAYKATDALKLKFGFAYDRTPIQHADRSARLPDSDRLWFSLGGQWDSGRFGKFDLGYAYVHAQDAGIRQEQGGNLLRGQYRAHSHVLGVQYSVGF